MKNTYNLPEYQNISTSRNNTNQEALGDELETYENKANEFSQKEKEKENFFQKPFKIYETTEGDDFTPSESRIYTTVKEALERRKENSTVEYEKELKKQIKTRYFSDEAIDQEIKNISGELFFYPTVKLASFLENEFNSPAEAIVYKCVAFRHGDLYLIKNEEFGKEVVHIMNNVISWGQYLFDLKKLESFATSKNGTADDRTYFIDDLNVKIRISEQGITVSYKNSPIGPFEFKNKLLREIAIDSLKKKATQQYYEFCKFELPNLK